jgi:hypothetical protein
VNHDYVDCPSQLEQIRICINQLFKYKSSVTVAEVVSESGFNNEVVELVFSTAKAAEHSPLDVGVVHVGGIPCELICVPPLA